MDLKDFARQHSLKIKRSRDDGTDNVLGKHGEIYDYSESELALIVCGGAAGTGRWARVRKKCIAAGMTLRQNGDDEGALSFSPANGQQSILAIKVIGARRRRRLSPEHTAKLMSANERTRFCGSGTVLNGSSIDESAVPIAQVDSTMVGMAHNV